MTFPQADYARGLQLVQSNPAESIRKAQANSNVDLKCIVNCIQSIPALQTPTIIQIFIANLASHLIPDPAKPTAARSPVALATDRAFASIMGLGNMGPFLQPSPHAAPFLNPLKQAWPGIWKWMQFFWYKNQDPRVGSPEQLKNTNQMISYAIYSMTHDDDLQRIITNTEGVIPMITKLWVDEEREVTGGEQASVPILPIPVSSAALHQILFEADEQMLDQVVVNSFPGAPEKVADFLLNRIRNAVKKPSAKLSAGVVQSFVDLTISFSRAPKHPLRHHLLSKGLLGVITKTLLVLTTRPLYEENVLEAITSCFGCISNLIECGDGITYIRQMITEGFLQAFVNIMPNFQRFDEEARSFTISLIEDLLPRYLVYRSVIESVVVAMRGLDTEACRNKVARSPVKKSWERLRQIAEARMMAKEMADETRKKLAWCDNCQKKGPKDTFKQCTGCKVTLYCSKECQVASWKKQHKAECNLKDQERIVFQSDALRKTDRVFLHALTIREARILLPTLRNLAKTKFPGISTSGLGIKIDYTRVPPVPSVFKLEGHDISTCTLSDEDVDNPISPSTLFTGYSAGLLSTGNKFDGARSREAQEKARRKVDLQARGGLSEKRTSGILKKAIDNEGRLTLIESIVSSGQTATMIMTLAARNIWVEGDWDLSEPGSDGGTLEEDWLMKADDEEDGNVLDLGGKLEEVALGLDLD